MTDPESTDAGTHTEGDSETEDEEQGSPRATGPDPQPGHRKTVMYVVGFLMVMFGVGWGSIPLYRMVCKSLDPGGSSASATSADEYKNVEVDKSRKVKVRFTANVQEDLPWEFRPLKNSVEVHPGEKKLVNFVSVNKRNRAITGKAVYDINPPEAGQAFKKIECFCFTEQTLDPGQRRKMPLYFWLEPDDLPEHVDKVTLGYTFFNAESSRERAKHTKNAGEPEQ